MLDRTKKIPTHFYWTTTGAEPVCDWSQRLDPAAHHTVGTNPSELQPNGYFLALPTSAVGGLESDLIDLIIPMVPSFSANQDVAMPMNDRVRRRATAAMGLIVILIIVPAPSTCRVPLRFILSHSRDSQLRFLIVRIRHTFDRHLRQLVIRRPEECRIGLSVGTYRRRIDRQQSDMYMGIRPTSSGRKLGKLFQYWSGCSPTCSIPGATPGIPPTPATIVRTSRHAR
jgi:hypothetical protein